MILSVGFCLIQYSNRCKTGRHGDDVTSLVTGPWCERYCIPAIDVIGTGKKFLECRRFRGKREAEFRALSEVLADLEPRSTRSLYDHPFFSRSLELKQDGLKEDGGISRIRCCEPFTVMDQLICGQINSPSPVADQDSVRVIFVAIRGARCPKYTPLAP